MSILEIEIEGETINELLIKRPRYDDIEVPYIKIDKYIDKSVDRYYCKRFELIHPDLYTLCLSGDSNYQNTCAIRMSYGLNIGGFKIKKYAREFLNARTGDSVIASVNGMIKYLKTEFGKSDLEFNGNIENFKSKIDGKKGIVIFKIPIWNDATGHVTLWDGKKCIDNSEHFYDSPTDLLFWELK
ncbi:MAG: hypothetical protein GY932_08760 [Arcobacter sp.]|nr:hypothetical protein [Arcobacter sp.]